MLKRLNTWLVPPLQTDVVTQRRRQTLGNLLLAVCTMSFLGLISSLILDNGMRSGAIISVSFLIYALSILTLRRGHTTIASILLIAGIICVVTFNIAIEPYPFSVTFLSIVVVVCSTIMSGRHVWLVSLSFIPILGAIFTLFAHQTTQNQSVQAFLFGCGIFLFIITLLSHLNATSITYALKQSEQSNQEASKARADLLINKRNLEERIAERTNILAQALDQQRKQTETTRENLVRQEQLHQTILELSLPVIPISDHVLVVPLIGAINNERAHQMIEMLLKHVERSQARALVLDVTGIALIDTHTAGVILQIANAMSLLGARMVLVGIRPEVAQTLVMLGVDLQHLLSAASLQEGLRLVNVHIVAAEVLP